MAEEHEFVRLARATIERHVCEGATLAPPKPLSAALARRAGAFVSLHRHGDLRGCIGTIEPVRANLAQEIMANAISAATHDPRFDPVGADELADLEISVDVLEPSEPIASLAELDPRVYGVIVESGSRRGLLLPDLEGVDTAEQQVEIARRKAWIGAGEPVRLRRFRVTRYH